jgi:hypothetical protein
MRKAINRYHQHLRPRRHLMRRAINKRHQSHSELISAHSAARRPQLHAFRTCLRQSFAPAASPLAIALSFAESSDEASFIGPSLA